MILLKLGLLLIALKACGVYADEPPDKRWNICENKLVTLDKKCPSVLICYQSKLAKDSGNWKAGNRFRVNSPNASIAYECAGNDGTKGWHAVRISKDITGMMPLDSSFGSKSLSNVSNYPEINNDKELTSGGQSAGEEFMNALRYGAFMIDFDGMPLQIAALEIRQSIGKNDTKMCKTKCAAKWELQTKTPMETEPQTETPKDSSTEKIPSPAKDSPSEKIPSPAKDSPSEKIPSPAKDSPSEKIPKKDLSTTETSTKTMLGRVMPKAKHVDHFGTNLMQIEFSSDAPKFSLNVSISPYWAACAVHQRNNKADHIQDNYTKVANQDLFNACSNVPTSSVCNKSLEFYACYESIKNQTHINKEIAETCQKRLSQAPFVAGFRVQICMHRDAKKQILTFESRLEFSSSVQNIGMSREFQFKSGEVSKLMRYVSFSFTEFGHQPKEIHEASAKETTFTKLITRKTNLRPYQDNPDIIHPSRCDILGDNCEPIRKILEEVDKMQEWCALHNPTDICISPGRTPTQEDLKPFMRPPWDNTSLPSTKMPSNDTRTKDPLEAGDVLYTKDQAQKQYDYYVEMCSKCRNSSSEKVPGRQKRQHLFSKQWKSPIPIRYDPVSLGDLIIHATATIGLGAAQISEHTCIDFTFDETDGPIGIQIIDNGKRDRCGDSSIGQRGGWQELSINCEDMATGVHELLHALGLAHENERVDSYKYIKLNPLSKEWLHHTKNYEFPYDYGSIMHYPPVISDFNSYDKISHNRFYQQSMGQREKPSFKDYAIINVIYCNNTCGPEYSCKNGGYPNPRHCMECFCPWGYGGAHCEELQNDIDCKYKMVIERELEADWQTRTLAELMYCWSDRCVCNWRITPKDGKKLRIQLKRLEIESQCSHMPCHKSYIEINFRKDKRARGARLCCPEAISQMSPSQNWIEAEEPGTDIIISTSLEYTRGAIQFELTYETDGAKILSSEECPDPRELFSKERNPGGGVSCLDSPKETSKDLPCPRRSVSLKCASFKPDYHAWINGHPTNKTEVTMQCFKREDNPTSYWGYWANKTLDPVHIDDIQCVKYFREPRFKSAEVEDSAKVEDSFKNTNGSTVYMGFKPDPQ
uniref:Metalloendopeptidase n=1 Tax=Globodera rostochiensis TaxID=31243 RepID=A0A914I3Q1_GLORO